MDTRFSMSPSSHTLKDMDSDTTNDVTYPLAILTENVIQVVPKKKKN